MPITNNIIKLNNQALRPAPKFQIEYETFKSGEYIIGGVMKITLSGELYGSSQLDLDNKAKAISSYSAKCQSIFISCGSETLVNGVGYIRSVSITPTDQPFSVNYSIEIEVSDIGSSQMAVKKDSGFEALYKLSVPSNINLSKYEESLTINGDENLANNIFYVDSTYTQASLKLSGTISIQAYHHMCQNFGANDLTNQLYTIVNNRISKILSLSTDLSLAYPVLSKYAGTGFVAVGDTKTLTINKISNQVDIQFDMYIVKGTCHPKTMTTITIAESTDQSTGLSSFSAKGSIKGLCDRTTSALDNKTISTSKFTNATNTYNDIQGKIPGLNYYHYSIIGCLTAATAPDNICYQRISAQITEDFNNGQIDFDLSYGDTETCELGGSTIDINIQEDWPALKYVEHIIPGRGVALVQIGGSKSPYTVTITGSGKINSCDTSKITDLTNCVNNRFYSVINDRGYYNGILAKESITTGKYSYKISRVYIECV